MKFYVKMRDGGSFVVEASYIEVVTAPASAYTFLGPVPGYPVAILAAFPVEMVASVLPLEQAQRNDATLTDARPAGNPDARLAPRAATGPGRGPDREASNGEAGTSRPPRPPLPPIAAADV